MKYATKQQGILKYPGDKIIKYNIIENGIEYDVEEYLNGNKFWKYKDNIHRETGAAIEWNDGAKSWYKNGKLHKEDGPARILENGKEEYWLNGNYHSNLYSVDEWKQIVNEEIIKDIIE